MCTLSFIPSKDGYLIAMNRDERLTREIAEAPRVTGAGTLEAVYPREEGGGTWIAANQMGVAFALLNRNSSSAETAKLRSRGEVILTLLESYRLPEIEQRMRKMNLRGTHPFRLVAFSPVERTIDQWNWNAEKLEQFSLPWRARHWFSSGISDELAREVRGLACNEAWKRPDAGSVTWLRDLHASHVPEQGSFSICMHRQDAATVSYSEISCEPSGLTMRYRAGNPCAANKHFDSELVLHAPPRWAMAVAG